MGLQLILKQLHCFQLDQYHQLHCSIVTALMLMLSVNGP